ncbi:lipopolysaccharide biosynthesis protein [Frankia sp. R82]|uniref:lipopolysaccharide biosynthesis protein n=1 Tax=Frankia sp. R82 TaxID=2950553 RepID=UPI0020439C43|nr:hypothetical protein [Frankia sp. R82]MCM3884761.1 hypothetical protein [Frankia sp. R82]
MTSSSVPVGNADADADVTAAPGPADGTSEAEGTTATGRTSGTGGLSRATAAVLAGNAGTLLLGTATGALAARALGPTGRGELLTLQTWASMLAMVLSLGVSQALVTEDDADEGLLAPLLAQAAMVAAIGAALFTAAAVGGFGHRDDLEFGPFAVLGASLFAAATIVGSNAAGLAQRRGRMGGEFQVVRLVPAAGTLAVFVLYAAIGQRDPVWWLGALALTSLVPPLAYHLQVLRRPRFRRWRRRRPGAVHPPTVDRGDRPGVRVLPSSAFMRGALGAYGTVVGAQLIYKLDLLLVAILRPAREVAFYGVAVAFATACATICQATGMVVFSRLRTLVDPRARARTVRRATLATLGLATVIATSVALVAPLAIRVVYGADFVPATTATRVLVLAAIPQAVDYLLIHVLLGFRTARTVLAVQVPVAAATVAGLLFALHHGGLAAVAAVSGATYTASAAALYLACSRLFVRAAAHPMHIPDPRPSADTSPDPAPDPAPDPVAAPSQPAPSQPTGSQPTGSRPRPPGGRHRRAPDTRERRAAPTTVGGPENRPGAKDHPARPVQEHRTFQEP